MLEIENDGRTMPSVVSFIPSNNSDNSDDSDNSNNSDNDNSCNSDNKNGSNKNLRFRQGPRARS